MDKPKILIATAVRNADGSFAIADDEVDILKAYRTLEYGELSGMNAYGKPVTYTETYAEGGADVFFAEGNATTDLTMKLYLFGTLEEITADYHALVASLTGRYIRLADNIRRRKMILALCEATEPATERLYGTVYFSVSIKFTNILGRSYDISDNTRFT